MKKVKMILLSSIFMYQVSLNANTKITTTEQITETYDSQNKKSKLPIKTKLNRLKKSRSRRIIKSKSNSDDMNETNSVSSSRYPYGNSTSTQSSKIPSAPVEDSSETNSIKSSNKSSHATKSNTSFNRSIHTMPSSIEKARNNQSLNSSFKSNISDLELSKTTLNLNQLSSQNFNKYVQSQMDTNKINILESLNKSYESNSNIYENFMINIQKTKLYSIAKNFNININDLLKNISHEIIQVDFSTELNIQEQILNEIFDLVEKNLSAITNFSNIHSQLDESIKSLQSTVNTTDKKDTTTISLINSAIELLQNLKKNTGSFSDSIKADLDKIRVCYKIDFFHTLLSSTKDELKQEVLENRIKEIWNAYRLQYFEKNPNHVDLISKKSNKDTSIKDFNNVPIDFQEDLNSIINYAKNTTEKMEAIVFLIHPLSDLANLSDSLLGNSNSLEFLAKLQDSFEKMNDVIQKIEINNSLPNITSSINNLYTTLNDSLTLLLIETVKNAESINNQNNAGFCKFFKRTYVPFTLSGLASLRNVLMFNHFKIHSIDIVDKYSLSAHDWYSSNYRIPNILKTMSTDNQKSIVKGLTLQKSILLKLIETFNHNYQSKTLLTKKDYKHIKKLISQLQIIMNMLTALKAPSETTSSSLKTLEDLKFNLHSVSEDLSYIKRYSYQPNDSFFVSKKTKESESIQILTSETNNEQLKYLTKILYEFFNNGKKLTKVSEEDSKDLKDGNLFDLKTNHTELSNKK